MTDDLPGHRAWSGSWDDHTLPHRFQQEECEDDGSEYLVSTLQTRVVAAGQRLELALERWAVQPLSAFQPESHGFSVDDQAQDGVDQNAGVSDQSV
jgi:hypothetical protein